MRRITSGRRKTQRNYTWHSENPNHKANWSPNCILARRLSPRFARTWKSRGLSLVTEARRAQRNGCTDGMRLSEFWDSQKLLVTTSEIRRNRLSTVARTLRRFRLVDSFGLGELAQRDRLPS